MTISRNKWQSYLRSFVNIANPFLKDQPCFNVVPVMKSQLFPCLLVETPRFVGPADEG